MKTVVFLASIVLFAHCFGLQKQEIPEKPNFRIVVGGGQAAHIGQYPWVARLELFNTEGVVFCDGSLISDRFVLSAAHCVIENPNNIKVYLGEYDTTTFPEDCEGNQCIENQLVIADKFVWHADYDRHTISNDIALLRLANRATLSGGEPAHIGQYPWMARLVMSSGNDNFTNCAGSLISDRYVLTAAHCVQRIVGAPHYIKIYLRDFDTNTFPKDCDESKCIENVLVYVDKILLHEDYNSNTFSNDIALLRLQKKAPLSAYIQPISLPPVDIDTEENQHRALTVVGWGSTRTSNTSTILQTAEIYLMPVKQCENMYPRLQKAPPKHLCAGDSSGKDACPGDSGGPLLMFKDQYYVSGIVSYGPRLNCGARTAGFYTNVFKYKDWIKGNMEV